MVKVEANLQKEGRQVNITNEEIRHIAMVEYIAYGNNRNWLNAFGGAMPEWIKLPPEIQEAWVAATKAGVVWTEQFLNRWRGLNEQPEEHKTVLFRICSKTPRYDSYLLVYRTGTEYLSVSENNGENETIKRSIANNKEFTCLWRPIE